MTDKSERSSPCKSCGVFFKYHDDFRRHEPCPGPQINGTIVDQPAPIATSRRPAWELVIEYTEVMQMQQPENKRIKTLVLADMRERDKVGRERYGTPLQAGNGRRHLIDAYQEHQDFAVYLRTWLDEQGVSGDLPTRTLDEYTVIMLFRSTVLQLFTLRELIERGL